MFVYLVISIFIISDVEIRLITNIVCIRTAQGPLHGSVESMAMNRSDFAEIYGGLFFLGILLSIVFVVATTLIMYYKQISEGYEDQGRFEILQKVGMTKKEVKKSINSQVMTVFFLPLIAAGDRKSTRLNSSHQD